MTERSTPPIRPHARVKKLDEAAVFSTHAAGVVVGKFDTAAVSTGELLPGFALQR